MRTDREPERPPVESRVIDERDTEPEGIGHVESDEGRTEEQERDPRGQQGPSYERDQGDPRQENSGGSSDPNSSLSHADAGRPQSD